MHEARGRLDGSKSIPIEINSHGTPLQNCKALKFSLEEKRAQHGNGVLDAVHSLLASFSIPSYENLLLRRMSEARFIWRREAHALGRKRTIKFAAKSFPLLFGAPYNNNFGAPCRAAPHCKRGALVHSEWIAVYAAASIRTGWTFFNPKRMKYLIFFFLHGVSWTTI